MHVIVLVVILISKKITKWWLAARCMLFMDTIPEVPMAKIEK